MTPHFAIANALTPIAEHVEARPLEFNRLVSLFEARTGIKLTDDKVPLVSHRLQHRLRHHGLNDFGGYLDLLERGLPGELEALVDALTTHETSFFREARHFEVVLQHARRSTRLYRAWSAACSTGEELASLALVLAEHPGVRWEAVGTDISPDVVRRAAEGVFPIDRAATIPELQRRRWCLRGTGPYAGTFCLAPRLWEKVRFQVANLLEPQSGLGTFDVALVRNVLIYFDPPKQRQILFNVARQVRPGGLVIVGHAETANGVPGLRRVESSVYEVLAP